MTPSSSVGKFPYLNTEVYSIWEVRSQHNEVRLREEVNFPKALALVNKGANYSLLLIRPRIPAVVLRTHPLRGNPP
jgi:hypothetical protein